MAEWSKSLLSFKWKCLPKVPGLNPACRGSGNDFWVPEIALVVVYFYFRGFGMG